LNLLTAYHTPLPQSRDNRGFIALYIGLYRLHVKLSHWKTRYRNQGMITEEISCQIKRGMLQSPRCWGVAKLARQWTLDP
jgi:hypothetical protein